MSTLSLTGVTISDTSSPARTLDQLGGSGTVLNKALAIPGHLNGVQGGPWRSIESVTVAPVLNTVISSVGLHTQTTDEFYFIYEGAGILTTNGEPHPVTSGCLAIAPRGTAHTLRNESVTTPLSFLVIEIEADPVASFSPQFVQMTERFTASNPLQIHATSGAPRVAEVDLSEAFSGPWGTVMVLDVPSGGRSPVYLEETCDQLFFVSKGNATFFIGKTSLETGRSWNEVGEQEKMRIFSSDEGHQCLVVPCGVPCGFENRASGEGEAYALTLLLLTVKRMPRMLQYSVSS